MVMSDSRLDSILESYGAAPERWPLEQRAAALALLGRSDPARRRWVEAAALDVAMVPDKAPEPSEDLMNRLKAIPVDAAMQHRRRVVRPTLAGFLGSVRLPAAGAFAAVMLAFLAGLAVPTPFGGTATEPTLLATADSTDNGFVTAAADGDIAIVDTWSADTETLDDDGGDPELAVLDLALE